MTAQTIEIPLPPRHCQSNGFRVHWAAKSKAIRQYRQEAFYCARAAHAEPMKGMVRLSVTAYMAPKRGDGRYRAQDAGNLIGALKAAIDGIVDAAVIPDDNHKCLEWGSVRFLTTKEEHLGRSCVELCFEEITT